MGSKELRRILLVFITCTVLFSQLKISHAREQTLALTWSRIVYSGITTTLPTKKFVVGKCEASDVTTTGSYSFPDIEKFKEKFEDIAEKAPMISEATFTIGGAVSRTTGEECCSEYGNPTDYVEWSGNANVGISVELAIPGLNWKVNSEFKRIYKVKAEISLGPTVTVGPTASLGITGHDGECNDCITVSGSITIDLGVKVGGKLEAEVLVFEDTWIEFGFGAEAEVSFAAISSIGGGASYKYGDNCEPVEGWQDTEITWGKVDLTGTLAFGIEKVGSISLALNYTLMEGGSYQLG